MQSNSTKISILIISGIWVVYAYSQNNYSYLKWQTQWTLCEQSTVNANLGNQTAQCIDHTLILLTAS